MNAPRDPKGTLVYLAKVVGRRKRQRDTNRRSIAIVLLILYLTIMDNRMARTKWDDSPRTFLNGLLHNKKS